VEPRLFDGFGLAEGFSCLPNLKVECNPPAPSLLSLLAFPPSLHLSFPQSIRPSANPSGHLYARTLPARLTHRATPETPHASAPWAHALIKALPEAASPQCVETPHSALVCGARRHRDLENGLRVRAVCAANRTPLGSYVAFRWATVPEGCKLSRSRFADGPRRHIARIFILAAFQPVSSLCLCLA
jgi:hypothetical protein